MLSDPIADMLTRIRNANMMRHDVTEVQLSRMNLSIARILREEGYIKYFKPVRNKKSPKGHIRVFLRYGPRRERVITQLDRASKPGLRRYAKKDEIPFVLGGMGIALVSTSRGVMTGRKARRMGIGGELLCYVW